MGPTHGASWALRNALEDSTCRLADILKKQHYHTCFISTLNIFYRESICVMEMVITFPPYLPARSINN